LIDQNSIIEKDYLIDVCSSFELEKFELPLHFAIQARLTQSILKSL